MKKKEFLRKLRASLGNFSDEETKEIINYYEEMIDEKIEQGHSEIEVVADLGNIDYISSEIKNDLVSARITKKQGIRKTWNNFSIVLLTLFSPALLPLAITFCILFVFTFVFIYGLAIGFGGATIGMIIGIIPVSISAGAEFGTAGAILFAGITVVLIALFAFISISCFYGGTRILNKIIQFFINKRKEKGGQK